MCATEWSATDSTTFTVCAVTDCCCCDDDRMPTTNTTTMWRRRKEKKRQSQERNEHTQSHMRSMRFLDLTITDTAHKRRYTLHTEYTKTMHCRHCTNHHTIDLRFFFLFASLTSFPCVFLSVRMSKWHFSIYLPPFLTHTRYCTKCASSWLEILIVIFGIFNFLHSTSSKWTQFEGKGRMDPFALCNARKQFLDWTTILSSYV